MNRKSSRHLRVSVVSLLLLLAGVRSHGDVFPKYLGNPVLTGSDPTGGPVVLDIGGTYHMWYVNGWDFYKATSTDGLTWTEYGSNPIFDGGGQLSLGTVRYTGSQYQMWYSVGGGSGQSGYMYSSDGLSWTDVGVVLSPGPGSYDAYAASLPAVLYDAGAGKYKMWYSAGESSSAGRQIAYALADDPDGPWEKQGVVFSPESATWYSQSVHMPMVEKTSDGYVMWFQGSTATSNGIGYVTSADGITWDTSSVALALSPGTPGEWDGAEITNPWILPQEGVDFLYYSGSDTAGVNPTGIGVAFVPEPTGLLLLVIAMASTLMRRPTSRD